MRSGIGLGSCDEAVAPVPADGRKGSHGIDDGAEPAAVRSAHVMHEERLDLQVRPQESGRLRRHAKRMARP